MGVDSIFRAYDIRGVFGEDLTEETAERLGAAFGEFVGEGRTVVVARDVRLSGEALRDALVSGLRRSCDVIDVGMTSTPMLFYAVNHLEKDAGIMITASHNPKEWNGFKLFSPEGAIYGEDMEWLKRRTESVSLEERAIRGGLNLYKGIIEDYIDFVLRQVEVGRRMNVVLDTANGVCGLIAPPLFKRLGCNVITINEEPDGNFPAHEPEPKEETLSELKETVLKTNADFGVGFDGDGDRAVFVDEEGKVIPGDVTLMVFIEHILRENPGGKVVFEVSCSMAVEEFIRKFGGVPVVERVGHTFMMQRMRSEGAVLGGEKSSHFYFKELRGMDDAVYASVKMAEILSESELSLSDIVSTLPRYHSIYEENIECPDALKFTVIERLKEKFFSSGFKVNDLDGVKLIDEDGWVLLRASNTQPLIRVSVEARTQKKLEELHSFALSELKSVLEDCRVAGGDPSRR